MRRTDDRTRLLHGPYHPPRLHVGERTTCLYRDCDVVVTSWTDAPISWPRCLPVGRKGHPSLLLNEALARAEARLKETSDAQHALKPKHPAHPRLKRDRERYDGGGCRARAGTRDHAKMPDGAHRRYRRRGLNFPPQFPLRFFGAPPASRR